MHWVVFEGWKRKEKKSEGLWFNHRFQKLSRKDNLDLCGSELEETGKLSSSPFMLTDERDDLEERRDLWSPEQSEANLSSRVFVSERNWATS